MTIFRRVPHPLCVRVLQTIKWPFDRHAQKELPGRFISARGSEGVLGDRVRIPEMAMKTIFIPDTGRACGGVHEIYSSGARHGSMRGRELELHFPGHVNDVARDRALPHFFKRFIKVGARRTERGFSFAN
jgi:hypothetical protein